MKPIQILLLGPPQVYRNGQPVLIASPPARSLLYYLAAQGGSAPVGRLQSLLDGSSAPETSSSELASAWAALKQALDVPDLFQDSPFMVRLNPSAIYVDQIDFQDLLDRWGRAAWSTPTTGPLLQTIYESLTAAANLWRTSQYLESYQPDTQLLQDWLQITRRAMHRLYGRVLERLADHHLSLHEMELALDFTRRALLVDPLNETLHEQYLRSLIDLNRTAEASAHFAQTQALLIDQTGIPPGPRLVRQYARVHQMAPGLTLLNPEPEWRLNQGLGAPFVGRQTVLHSLEGSFQRGGGLLLMGESGGGKTRLLQEFIRRVNPRPRVLLGQSQPQEMELPFKPILEALRFQIQPDEWMALAPAWASQLSLLLPELREIRPELDQPPVNSDDALPSEAISMLFEAIRQLMLLVAGKQRVFFCLDDAQWADDASLRTMEYLLQRPPFDGRGLLLLAARSEEINPRLEAWANRLSPKPFLDIIQLDRLATAEIAQLAGSVLNRKLHPDFISHLERETGGNPLFILETLSAWLAHSSHPEQENPVTLPLGLSLKTLILDRLSHLQPAARETLAAAAVTGLEFDPEVVAQALEQRQRVLEELRELEQRGLIAPLLGNKLHYTFVHNKIREALIDELSPPQQRELHQKIARALDAVLGKDAPNQAVILAEHYERGGEARLAFDYWLAASRRARQLFSLADALQALHHAARCASATPELPDEQMHTLYLEWTEASYVNEDQITLEQINQELLAIGRARGSQLLVGAALNGLCDAALVSNQFHKGLEYASQALAELENSPHQVELIEAYNHYGMFLYMLGQAKQAVLVFKKALAVIAPAASDKTIRARANAHYQLAVCHLLSAMPGLALRHAEESLAGYSSLNRYMGMVNALSVLSMAHYYLGNPHQARLDCERGLTLGQRIHAWRMLGYLHTYRAIIALAEGDLETAYKQALLGIEIGERYQHGEMISGGYRLLADLHLWLREPSTAVDYAQRAREYGKNTFMEFDASIRLGCGLALLQQESGLQIIQEVEHSASLAGLELIRIEAQLSAVYLYILQSQWKKLAALGQPLLKEVKRLNLRYQEQLVTIYLAENLLNTGKTAQAAVKARAAARSAHQAGLAWAELTARITLHAATVSVYGPGSVQAGREYKRIGDLLEAMETGLEEPALKESLARLRLRIDQQLRHWTAPASE